MTLATHMYLVPLVDMEITIVHNPADPLPGEDEVERAPQYKHVLYEPDLPNDGGEARVFNWMSWPADDPNFRFVRLTCDAVVHEEVYADRDIKRLF